VYEENRNAFSFGAELNLNLRQGGGHGFFQNYQLPMQVLFD
jgi:hypothetical protein